jgi:predicted short-subunit dehydrogenase-like oxidoreductase (DUF2520 family)
LVSARPSFGFIGAGHVARSLAPAIASAGYEVAAVASRTPQSAEKLARLLPRAIASSPQGAVDAADLVIITTPDDDIAALAAGLHWDASKAVVHTSGALSSEALFEAAGQGAQTGGIHPLQTFAGDSPRSLVGVTFAIEAEPPLREVLRQIVAAIGGIAMDITAAAKPLYHAAAVMISNYTVTLTDLATQLWSGLDVDRETALRALLPLLEGTVANLKGEGLPAALTGPVARGDLSTIQANLSAISRAAPHISAIYSSLGLATIPIALEKGGLTEEEAVEVGRVLLEARGEASCLERKAQ